MWTHYNKSPPIKSPDRQIAIFDRLFRLAGPAAVVVAVKPAPHLIDMSNMLPIRNAHSHKNKVNPGYRVT